MGVRRLKRMSQNIQTKFHTAVTVNLYQCTNWSVVVSQRVFFCPRAPPYNKDKGAAGAPVVQAPLAKPSPKYPHAVFKSHLCFISSVILIGH